MDTQVLGTFPGSFGRIRSNVPDDMAVVEDLRLVGDTLGSLKVIGSTLNW